MIPILSITASFVRYRFKMEMVFVFYHVSTYFTVVASIRGKLGSQDASPQGAPYVMKPK
jgi:hypothetical protein